ncbi:MAG: response regulator [Rhodocyclaceae bacterium]
MKFTEHGKVTVRARLISADERSFRVRFEVEDTGIGMNEEQRNRLFRQFEQGDASTTRRFGGTGLGLAISHRLVELMGGEIGVDSTVGVGSTFWAVVSLARGDAVALEQALSEAADTDLSALDGMHILLTEDNAFNQQVACEMLADVGCTVRVANGGQEALDFLARERFDCVLMDVQMPGMDGLEATRRIRADGKLQGLKIIAMTANAFAEDRERCLGVGMDDFITKPVQASTLYGALRRARHGVQPVLAVAEAVTPPVPAQSAPAVEAPAEAMEDLPVLDIATLEKLARGKPEKMQHFARRFIETALQGLPELQNAMLEGDAAAVAAAGHRIKSSARWIGALKLGEQLHQLEMLGKDANLQAAAPILAALPDSIAELTCQVEAGFSAGSEVLARSG